MKEKLIMFCEIFKMRRGQKKTFFSMQPNLTTAHDLDLTKTHLAKSDTPLTSVA